MKKALIVGLLLAAVLVLVAGFSLAELEKANTPEETDAVKTTLTVPSGEVYTVVVKDGKFMPADLAVNAGDTVEWVNLDGVDHTVTFESCAIDMELPAGSTVRYTFTPADGTLYYGSLLHPKAQGSVTVNYRK